MPDQAGENAIFILGLQRSGTTWLANMLVGSEEVSGVTSTDHRGVHESIFFSHFAKAFGPFSDPKSRARFHEAFETSDYYILTGLDAAFLNDAIAANIDYEGVFQTVMLQVMQNNGCAQWLEKSPHHTLLADDLAARFPNAKYVCVTRDNKSLLASRLAAYGRTPATGVKRFADILRGTLVNALYSRHLQKFSKGNAQALLLNYDTFAAAPEHGRKQLASFLGLTVPPESLVSGFSANTSHDRGTSTRKLTALDQVVLTVGSLLGRSLPIAVLWKIEGRRRHQRGIDWPEWVWRRSGWRP